MAELTSGRVASYTTLRDSTEVGRDLLGMGFKVKSSSIASNRWLWAARARVPVIPSPRQGGMELCGRS